MNVSTVRKERGWLPLVTVFVLWFVAYFGARGLLEGSGMATWLRVVVAIVPVPIFAVFLVIFIRGIRDMDELQRRIQLEALAIAFPLAMLLIMTLALLQRAIDLPLRNFSFADVWYYLPIFYCCGVIIASKRYQ